MEILRNGSRPSGKGPVEYFTGGVRIDPLFQAPEPARVVGSSVTFEPGARTAWHSHPLGQTLIVTAGCGRVQRWGGPTEEIRPGDVIWNRKIIPGKVFDLTLPLDQVAEGYRAMDERRTIKTLLLP
jgi:quercetin dioxygenase-like cupin family protein